jgi:hypothetical protein
MRGPGGARADCAGTKFQGRGLVCERLRAEERRLLIGFGIGVCAGGEEGRNEIRDEDRCEARGCAIQGIEQQWEQRGNGREFVWSDRGGIYWIGLDRVWLDGELSGVGFGPEGCTPEGS